MKFKGWWFGNTENAYKISWSERAIDIVLVPQARCTLFKKLATKNPDQLPREVEFAVESWLAATPDYRHFKEV